MFDLGYITLCLLQIKLGIITAQIPMISQSEEITKDNLLSEDTLLPKNNMKIHQNTHEPIRKPLKLKSERSNADRRYGFPRGTTVRKFGPLVNIPEFVPKSYEDPYVLAKKAQNQGINHGFLIPQSLKPSTRKKEGITKNFRNKIYSTRMYGYKSTRGTTIEKAKSTVDPNFMSKTYDDTNIPETEPITQGFSLSTINELKWDPKIYYDEVSATTTERNIEEFYELQNVTAVDVDETGNPTMETTSEIITEPVNHDNITRAHVYVLYTVTRTIYKRNNKAEKNRLTYTKSRSTNPLTFPHVTVTKVESVVKNKPKIQQKNAFTHPAATKTKIVRTSTAKITPLQKSNGPFIKVYDYLENLHVSKAKDAKRLKELTKYNPNYQHRAFDDTHPLITEIISPEAQKNKQAFDQNYDETKTSETIIESYDPPEHKLEFMQKFDVTPTKEKGVFRSQVTQTSKPAFIKNTIKIFSTHLTNRAGLGPQVNDAAKGFRQNFDVTIPTKEKGILRARVTQKIKPEFIRNTNKRFSTPLINRPSLEPEVNYIPKVSETATETFNGRPLNQPAYMQANFDPDDTYPPKNEYQMQAFNGLEEKAFDTYPTPTKENNQNGNLPMNYAFTPRLEEDEIGVTESVYPWIKTVSPTTRKKASYMTYYLPESRQTTASSLLYPWLLTRVFRIGTTKSLQKPVNLIYEYPELGPKEALRSQSEPTQRLGLQTYTATPEPIRQTQIFTSTIEPKLEDTSFQGTVQEEAEPEPFSIFLEKLVKILGSKSLKALQDLVVPFGRYVTILLDSGKLMKLGLATASYIAQVTSLLNVPIKEIQRQIFIIQISLENRRLMLDDGFNAMLEELDDVYDVGEEDAMQRVLRETKLFPNSTKTGEQIVTGFIDDVLLHPMRRIAGTAKGNVVFESIAKVANKYNLPYDPIARRNENRRYNKFIDSPSVREELDKRNHRVMDKGNKPMKPQQQSAIHDQEYIKEERNIGKERIIVNTHLNDKDESSNGDNDGVEIKILINTRKYPKSNKRPLKIINEKQSSPDQLNLRNIDENEYQLSTGFRRNAKNISKTSLSVNESKTKEKKERVLIEAERRSFGSKNESKDVKNKTKVKIQFDCEPLPVIVSNKNETKEILSELVMYCSNATNASNSS